MEKMSEKRVLASFDGIGWFLPAAMLLVAVVGYPVVRTLTLSFLHENLATGFQAEFAGLDNFGRIIGDSRLHNSLRTTLLFTVVSVGTEFLVGLLLALSVDSLIRWRGLVRVIFLIPWTLPTAVIAVLWTWVFNDQFGLLNTVLMRLGLMDSPVAWLAQPGTAMAAMIVADVWKTTSFVFVILLAGLQNIPQDLYEAIEIDGGGAWTKFRSVTWPHLLPFVFVSVIFRIVQAFAIFDLVWVMTGGGPGGATETISVYSYQTYMRYLDFGYGSALAVATVAILGVTAVALYRLLVRKYERIF
jgi:trehalose/maltose transport system permease protein